MQGRRQLWRPQPKFAMHVQIKWQPQQCRSVIGIDQSYQAQAFAISAYQDMQAIVERDPTMLQPTRPAAEQSARLKYRHFHVLRSKRYRSRHAGIATTDYGNMRHAGIT